MGTNIYKLNGEKGVSPTLITCSTDMIKNPSYATNNIFL